MTRDPFLDLLGDELESRASTASSQRRFGPEAMARGRRIRTRRRIASATLAVLAVVGIAGTVAAVHDPSARPVTPPASTTVPTPAVTAAPAFAGVRVSGPIEVAALPVGAAPKAPYVMDRRLVDRGRVVDLPFRGSPARVYAVVRLGDGWIVSDEELKHAADIAGTTHLHAVAADGTISDLLPGSTVKGVLGRANGSAVVTLDGPADSGPTRVQVRGPGGKVLRSTSLPGDWRPVALLDDDAAMLIDAGSAGRRSVFWDLGSGRSVAIQGSDGLGGRGGVQVFTNSTTTPSGEAVCSDVFRGDPTRTRPIASSCTWSPDWPSFDGTLAVAQEVDESDGELTELRVVRPETPDVAVASFAGAFHGEPTWEDDAHFLVVATTRGKKDTSAVIRCSTDGRCERATDPAGSAPFSDSPIVLGPAG